VKNIVRAAVIFLVAALSGCASSTNAVFQSLQYAIQKQSGADRAPLNPDFRYLRATVDGRVALMVLGYTESHSQGPIEIWYSAEREVLRLQNGRIVGAAGLVTEWRNVSLLAPPSWSVLKASESAMRWSRVRDVMPGYHYGVREALFTRFSQPPASSALQGLDPKSLEWFEEKNQLEAASSRTSKELELPPARYAVNLRDGEGTVIYGEQCLAPKLCFTWQRWPAVEQPANRAKSATQ
jgi:hypothetical protein